jgi:hypothetical protein
MTEHTITVVTKKTVPVKYLRAECGVRYWEDATVNGTEDTDGKLIPFREGDAWRPLIDLDTGKIERWSEGTTASIHYKVCDDGKYELLDADKNVVASISGYVPEMMCPKGSGYGDYVIMEIEADGSIANWEVDFSEFEGDRDDD